MIWVVEMGSGKSRVRHKGQVIASRQRSGGVKTDQHRCYQYPLDVQTLHQPELFFDLVKATVYHREKQGIPAGTGICTDNGFLTPGDSLCERMVSYIGHTVVFLDQVQPTSGKI